MTANAAGPGAYILTCDGDNGRWAATINAELPTANTQVANKEYVDTVLAATANLPVCSDNYASLCALETSRAGNDPEFVPENIANGINILGVTGTLTGNLSGPAGCSNIGDKCADDTIFAGWNPINHEHIFIPPTDQGTSIQWKTSSGIDDITNDSFYDGRINSNQISNTSVFPAFKLCKDLTFGGYSDWYLPSRVEIYYLWSIYEAIQNQGNISNFQSGYYWSSTEHTVSGARSQSFPGGSQDNSTKTNSFNVRCIRR